MHPLLKRFDLDKVRRVMRTTGHRWARHEDGRTRRYFPSEEELRDVATRLIERAEREGGRHHTGGLVAQLVGNLLRLEYLAEEAEMEFTRDA